jgi:hypothetical protein
LSVPPPVSTSVNSGSTAPPTERTPLQDQQQHALPVLKAPHVPAVDVHALMGATTGKGAETCIRTVTCMDASASMCSPVELRGSGQPKLQVAAVAELGTSPVTTDGRPVQPTLAQTKVTPTPVSSTTQQSAPLCPLADAVQLGLAMGRSKEISVADVSPGPGAAAPLGSPRSAPTPPPTRHSTPTNAKTTPIRRSDRHFSSADGSSATDENSLSKAMRRQAERNLDSPIGTPCNKSFLSFSGTRICSSLNNVGITIGKNNNDVRISVGALKHMEIDRLKVSPKCSSPLPYPETEEEESAATYEGPLLSHLVGAVTEVGLDDARPGSMFCDFTASSRKSKSHSSKKKQKLPKKAKMSNPTRVST